MAKISFNNDKYFTKENKIINTIENNKIDENNCLKLLPKEEKGKEVFLRKYCLIGAPNVGKTSIIHRFVYKKNPDLNNSLFERVHFKSFIYDNQIYDCKFGDTKGYETDKIVSYKYPYLCDGYFLVYSIDNRQSFELLPKLYEKILDKFDNTNIPVIVVGNKNDFNNTNRVVSLKEGAIMAKKFNNSPFLECNAFNEHLVNTIFEVMIYHDNKIRNLDTIQKNIFDECRIF
ncbi:GTPase RhebL1 [Strongyloides ratti]|uniref:GTPase RhebL1 n=1 Tax=Strongyloides ratti TaxID=34506 RepID=A0A090LNA7_STRRB|nr:GTPase RhebL1 [Strongyloides ratti]CEF71345.1 GTPase RhebL1 [Strongyloides ratti]